MAGIASFNLNKNYEQILKIQSEKCEIIDTQKTIIIWACFTFCIFLNLFQILLCLEGFRINKDFLKTVKRGIFVLNSRNAIIELSSIKHCCFRYSGFILESWYNQQHFNDTHLSRLKYSRVWCPVLIVIEIQYHSTTFQPLAAPPSPHSFYSLTHWVGRNGC